MKWSDTKNSKGFTLIETIIAIVAATILGVMAFTYSQTSLTKSAQPLNQSQKAMELQRVMENIFADYNLNYKTDLGGDTDPSGIMAKIGAEGITCNSGETTCVYGQYTVIDNHFIKYIDIDSDPDVFQWEEALDNVDPKNNNILKVTIKNDLGETLSILLTNQ